MEKLVLQAPRRQTNNPGTRRRSPNLLVTHEIPVTGPEMWLIDSAAEPSARAMDPTRAVSIKNQVRRTHVGQQPTEPTHIVGTLDHEYQPPLSAARHEPIIPEADGNRAQPEPGGGSQARAALPPGCRTARATP